MGFINNASHLLACFNAAAHILGFPQDVSVARWCPHSGSLPTTGPKGNVYLASAKCEGATGEPSQAQGEETGLEKKPVPFFFCLLLSSHLTPTSLPFLLLINYPPLQPSPSVEYTTKRQSRLVTPAPQDTSCREDKNGFVYIKKPLL